MPLLKLKTSCVLSAHYGLPSQISMALYLITLLVIKIIMWLRKNNLRNQIQEIHFSVGWQQRLIISDKYHALTSAVNSTFS